MKKKRLIIFACLAIVIILFFALCIRHFTSKVQGEGKCPVAIYEERRGWCIGQLSVLDRTEGILNEDYPDCMRVYSGSECNGIELFANSIAVN